MLTLPFQPFRAVIALCFITMIMPVLSGCQSSGISMSSLPFFAAGAVPIAVGSNGRPDLRTLALEGPHIRPIDRTCLPAGTSPPGEIPLYRGDIATIHAKIAYIDSYAADCNDERTVQAQHHDIQCKARLTGADAVINVRPLEHRVRGFVNDPNTPFPSSRQAPSVMFFIRGTAIKYQEAVVGDPAPIEIVQPPPPPGAVPIGTARGGMFGDLLGDRQTVAPGEVPPPPIPAINPLDAAAQPLR